MKSDKGMFLVLPKGKGVEMNIWLFNFGINKDQLKLEHVDALKTYVFPVLAAGGSATIVGMASRSGPNQLNLQLSKRRANSVSQQLIAFSSQIGNRLRSVTGVGEQAAKNKSMADDEESELYRAVAISVSSEPVPPPPPTPPPKKLDPLRNSCITGKNDPELINQLNNHEKWLVPGASGNNLQLHMFVKGFESQMSSPPTPGEQRLLDFYHTPFFRDWYIEGTCGVIPKYPMRQVSDWLSVYLTEDGRKAHGILIELVTDALKGKHM